MQTFLEYSKEHSILQAQKNSKSIMRGGRKHQNLLRKQYQHKHPAIDKIVNGHANNLQVAGANLMNLLQFYDTTYEPGKTKVLGNSGVEVQMSSTAGNPVGILINRKKHNGVLKQ